MIPYVIQQTENGEKTYDIYSRLLKERIIFLNGEINSDTANIVIAELLHLQAEDPNADITMYINSPGGSVIDGLAIYDTMNFINCDISTVCVGMCASMAAVLLSSGTKGKRFALENGEILIHQGRAGSQGTVADMTIEMNHFINLNEKTRNILSKNTSQSYEKIKNDTDRDYWLNSHQAVEYGLIDKVIIKNKPEI